MGKFGVYFESMVQLKPEWQKAYINYHALNKLIGTIKKGIIRYNTSGMVYKNRTYAIGSGLKEETKNLIDDTSKEKCISNSCSEPKGNPQPPMVRNCFESQFEIDDDDEDPLFIELRNDKKLKKKKVNESVDQTKAGPSSTLESQTGVTPLSSIGGRQPYQMSTRYGEGYINSNTSEYQDFINSNSILADCSQELAHSEFGTAYRRVSVKRAISDKGITSIYADTGLPVRLLPDAGNAVFEFERLLLSESQKACNFAHVAIDKYLDFFDLHSEKWRSQESNKKRSKENIRYFNSELMQLNRFIETNILCIKTATKKYLHAHPFLLNECISESHLLPSFIVAKEQVESLRSVVSALWTELFESGDGSKVSSKLNPHTTSATQAFRAGFFTSMLLGNFLYWLHVIYELKPEQSTFTLWELIFPVFRLLLFISFLLMVWSAVLFVFMTSNINYQFIFGFPPLMSVTWLQCYEFSVLLMLLSSMANTLYLRSHYVHREGYYHSAEGFPALSPYIAPLTLIIFIGVTLYPPRRVMRKSRTALLRVLVKCVKLPFSQVGFVDFFIADWGTSISPLFADILYVMCFYTALPSTDFNRKNSDVCFTTQSHYGNILAMIPFYWRGWQTFLMYRRTGNKVHIVNHCKYLSIVLYMVLDTVNSNYTGTTAVSSLIWVTHVWAELYCFTWDVLMDWGWIRGKKRETVFSRKWVYIAAVVFDFIARMFFIIVELAISDVISKSTITVIQGCLEILRRGVWSVFRIENENMNNLETYRKIDFVPTVLIEYNLE